MGAEGTLSNFIGLPRIFGVGDVHSMRWWTLLYYLPLPWLSGHYLLLDVDMSIERPNSTLTCWDSVSRSTTIGPGFTARGVQYAEVGHAFFARQCTEEDAQAYLGGTFTSALPEMTTIRTGWRKKPGRDTPPAISALGVTQCGLEGHRAIPYVKGGRHLRGDRLNGYVFCPRPDVFG